MEQKKEETYTVYQEWWREKPEKNIFNRYVQLQHYICSHQATKWFKTMVQNEVLGIKLDERIGLITHRLQNNWQLSQNWNYSTYLTDRIPSHSMLMIMAPHGNEMSEVISSHKKKGIKG